MLIFLNMMNSQSDKTGILDVLEITFLQPKYGGQPLTDFLNIFLWILPFVGGITTTFLRKGKKAKFI